MLKKQIFNRKYKWDQCNFWHLEVFQWVYLFLVCAVVEVWQFDVIGVAWGDLHVSCRDMGRSNIVHGSGAVDGYCR